MNLFDEHDRFVRKNASTANGYNLDRKDKKLTEKGASHLQQGQEASCFNCKHKQSCRVFDKMRTGGSSGVVSYGGDQERAQFICEKYELMKNRNASMSDKQIKSLMKNAMRGNMK